MTLYRPLWPSDTPLGLARALDQLTDGVQREFASVIASMGGDPVITTYTPTITQGGTLGNGTLEGVYCTIGQFVYLHTRLVIGSTTSLNSSQLRITAPIAGRSGVWQVGSAGAYDSSAALDYPVLGCVCSNATTIYFWTSGTTWDTLQGAYINNAVPFTWATGDALNFSVAYISV